MPDQVPLYPMKQCPIKYPFMQWNNARSSAPLCNETMPDECPFMQWNNAQSSSPLCNEIMPDQVPLYAMKQCPIKCPFMPDSLMTF